MPESASRKELLATVTELESAAFRIAHVARKLITEHPDLAPWQIQPHVSVFGDRDGPKADAVLRLFAADFEQLHAWAGVLGTEVQLSFYEGSTGTGPFLSGKATAEIDGIPVEVSDTRSDLAEDELTTWRARQAEASSPQGGDAR
ncbi:hypothetical protein [Streptomyces sp. NPDC000888]